MFKLLLVLLAVPGISYASLDMQTLACNKLKLNSGTTLLQVQDNCLIKSARNSKGRYEVNFVNTTTDETVTCYFATNTPTALLNSCH